MHKAHLAFMAEQIPADSQWVLFPEPDCWMIVNKNHDYKAFDSYKEAVNWLTDNNQIAELLCENGYDDDDD